MHGLGPLQEELTQGRRGFGQLFPVGEGCHLLNRSPFAVALGAMAAADFAFIVFDSLGNVFELTDQLPQGDRALQRRGGYGAAPEMPFGPARHLEAGVHQPALAIVVEIKAEAVVLD